MTGPREPALRKARVCYDHLAGELGVLAYEAFKKRRFLRVVEGELDLTPAGRAFFDDLGASWERSARRPVCRPCLDWSERRHHLAGSAGAAFLDRIQQLGWARRQKDSRVVAFTPRGEAAFREALSG